MSKERVLKNITVELHEALPRHPWEKETAGERIRIEGIALELSAGLIFMLPISYIK